MDIKEAYIVLQNASGIKKGDTVKVIRSYKSEELGNPCEWVPHMDETVGLTGVVRLVYPDYIVVWFESIQDYWSYPFFVLEKLSSEEAPKKKKKKSYIKRQEESNIKLGMKVHVIRTASSGEEGWSDAWNPKMDSFVGNIYNVESIHDSGIELINEEGDSFVFPYFILEEVKDLAPFTQVLGRDSDDAKWLLDIYKSYNPNAIGYPYECFDDCYASVIPYAGNEKLFGTKKASNV